MLSFNLFITEAKKASSALSDTLLSDDKGKLNEIHTGNEILKAATGKKPAKGKLLLAHHRSKSEEYGGTPQQVSDKLETKVGKAAFNEVKKHSESAAHAVIQHLTKTGKIGGKSGYEITDVHWTSNRDRDNNPGDHEKTTGIRDMNSNADIIVTTTHKKAGKKQYHPMSLKYGSQDKPNFKNAGLDSLEKEAGVAKGTYSKIQKKHETNMAKLGYTGSKKERHTQYKEDKAIRETKPNHPRAKRATAAEEAAVQSRSDMAATHRKALSKLSDEHLRNIVRNNVSAPTKIPHLVMHTQVNPDASVQHHIHNADSMADEHLNKFKDLHVANNSGISVKIMGTHKDTDKKMTVASQTFKGSSGPHKGTAGVFKLG